MSMAAMDVLNNAVFVVISIEHHQYTRMNKYRLYYYVLDERNIFHSLYSKYPNNVIVSPFFLTVL